MALRVEEEQKLLLWQIEQESKQIIFRTKIALLRMPLDLSLLCKALCVLICYFMLTCVNYVTV